MKSELRVAATKSMERVWRAGAVACALFLACSGGHTEEAMTDVAPQDIATPSDACAKPCGKSSCCGVADECSPVSQTCVPLRKLGVVYGLYGTNPLPSAAQLAATKASIARVFLSWAAAEPKEGVYSWTEADARINTIYAGGVDEVMVCIAGDGSWDPFPAALSRYVNYVGALVARYKARVRKWQILNEPNVAIGGKLELAKEQVVLVHNAAYAKIKSIDPAAEVANAGIALLNYVQLGAEGSTRGIDWLKGLIALGAKIDAVAVHPYATNGHGPTTTPDTASSASWNSFRDLELVIETLEKAGSAWASKPVWVTEWGWTTLLHAMASGSCEPNRCLLEPGQCLEPPVARDDVEAVHATYTNRSLQLLRDSYPSVKIATLYMLADRTDATAQRCAGWGLFRLDGSRKPALDLFKAYGGRL